MKESTRTILQWLLIGGVVVAGGKVVYDMMKAPPPIADTTPTTTKTEPSASESSDEDQGLNLPPPRPHEETDDTATANTATPPPTTDASASASASSSANAPAGSLAQVLIQIAANPKGSQPLAAQRDPQTGLFVFIYQDLPGLTQPVLLVVPGEPTAWAWQLQSDLPVDKITSATKLEKMTPPRPGVTQVKIVGGPFDGAVAIIPGDRPKLRVIKSPGFVQLEADELKKQQAAMGGGGGAPGGSPH